MDPADKKGGEEGGVYYHHGLCLFIAYASRYIEACEVMLTERGVA